MGRSAAATGTSAIVLIVFASKTGTRLSPSANSISENSLRSLPRLAEDFVDSGLREGQTECIFGRVAAASLPLAFHLGTLITVLRSKIFAGAIRLPQCFAGTGKPSQRKAFVSVLFGLTAMVLFAIGCGPSGLPNMVPIKGKVTLNGKPITTGTVIYIPDVPGGRQARGEIAGDGSFALTTLRAGDGAQEGDYHVVVIAYEPYAGDPTREQIEAAGGNLERKLAIPEKFTKKETSGLTDKVDSSHSGTKNLELSTE